MAPLQYLLLKRACSLFLFGTLLLESIGLNIIVAKSNGHCPLQLGPLQTIAAYICFHLGRLDKLQGKVMTQKLEWFEWWIV